MIWRLGGDVRPTRHEIYDALARGIAQGLGRDPLMSYHPPGGTYRPPATSTGEFYHDKPWLDFNMIQSGHRRGNESYLRIAEDYARTPTKPVVDAEPCYEQHPILHNYANGSFEAAVCKRRARPAAARGWCTPPMGASSNSGCRPPRAMRSGSIRAMAAASMPSGVRASIRPEIPPSATIGC